MCGHQIHRYLNLQKKYYLRKESEQNGPEMRASLPCCFHLTLVSYWSGIWCRTSYMLGLEWSLNPVTDVCAFAEDAGTEKILSPVRWILTPLSWFLGLFCTVVTSTVSVHQPLYSNAPYTVIFSEDLIIEMLLSSTSFLQLLYQGTPNKWRKKTNFVLTCLEFTVMVLSGLPSFCGHSSRLFSFH